MEGEPHITPYIKKNLKCIEELNGKTKTIKLLEKNNIFVTFGYANIFKTSQPRKKKNDKLYLIKMKPSYQRTQSIK